MTSSVSGLPAGLWNYDANDRYTMGDTYDNDGNTVSSGGIADVYDFENRLVQQAGLSIIYDGDGNRVSKTVAGVTTKFLVDDVNPTGYAQVVDELQGTAVTRSYTWGLELISEHQTLNSTLATSYYVFDGHGSVRALTNSSGAVTDTYDYDAFGILTHSTGTTPNNYLFAGEQFDPDLHLYYNRARYLNTSTGRFWAMDTDEGSDGAPFSLHKYLYASCDPINFGDPSGHLVEEEPIAALESEKIELNITVEIPKQAPKSVSLATRAFQILSGIAILTTALLLEGDNSPNPGPVPVKRKNPDEEIFYRFGFRYESADALEAQSQLATQVLGVHGVSVSTRANYPAPFATRAEIETKFRLLKTGSSQFHYTVVLPTPVTDGDALAFNTIFKRKIPTGLF
jgi:RHS repeat-associated protein